MLVVLCGLPGVGKSVLADDLGARTGWPVLSVDPIEAAIRRAGVDPSQPVGLAAYAVVEALAERVLRPGRGVIIDAVNDAPAARQQWLDLAVRARVPLRFVEVVCSDEGLHRWRFDSRPPKVPELSWDQLSVRRHELASWTGARLVVDSVNAVDSMADRVIGWL